MSIDNIFIHNSHDNNHDVYIGKRGAYDLFNFLLPKFIEYTPSFSDQFEGEYYGEVLSISSLPKKEFQIISKFIFQACDEIESLKLYKTELQEALQKDARYTH